MPITLSDIAQKGPGETQVSIWSCLLRIVPGRYNSPRVTLPSLQLIAITQWPSSCTARVCEKSLCLERAFGCGTVCKDGRHMQMKLIHLPLQEKSPVHGHWIASVAEGLSYGACSIGDQELWRPVWVRLKGVACLKSLSWHTCLVTWDKPVLKISDRSGEWDLAELLAAVWFAREVLHKDGNEDRWKEMIHLHPTTFTWVLIQLIDALWFAGDNDSILHV